MQTLPSRNPSQASTQPATRLTSAEIRELIQAQGETQEWLFRSARQARQGAGVDPVTLRGVIEFSSFCQKNCNYCAMRASNQELERYRMTAEDLLAIAAEIHRAGIPIIFFQGGQDRASDPMLMEVIPEIRRRYDLEILLCLGERPRSIYEKFAELGANSYILKFEIGNPQLHQAVINTPLEWRVRCIRDLQALGYRVGTGNIVGMPGQTLDNLVEDIELIQELDTDFFSSSPFIPNANTPLEGASMGDVMTTLNIMAIYRLLKPQALIPTVSALEKILPDGQLMGLNAGANVMTINFTPNQQRDQYHIYSDRRFIVSYNHAIETVQRAGLPLLHPLAAA
jgi:biotin synthase